MGSEMTSYLDFAENDYKFFRTSYDSGNKGGPLAAIGQNICEKYLKHIISEYTEPESEIEEAKKERILKTHSLHKLLSYCLNDMKIEIPEHVENSLECIDGYYFTTRYPGDDSFIPTERDVDKANIAVINAREFTMEICREMELTEHENEYNFDNSTNTINEIGD